MKNILFILALLLSGCMTPSEHFADTAKHYGFQETTLETKRFLHKIYANTYSVNENTSLHVYLDGDGTPLAGDNVPTKDPTARQPLILSLMAQDRVPAIVLGRPCYYGLSATMGCGTGLWTERRYAPEVLESMVDVLTNFLKQHPFKKIVLIGYSGGGALAVLMAGKMASVQTVVTVAANLDVDSWARRHHHEPLAGSLNPIAGPALNKTITQLHLAGGKDENVPPYIIKAYVDKQQGYAKYQVYQDFTHQCCWDATWGEILKLF